MGVNEAQGDRQIPVVSRLDIGNELLVPVNFDRRLDRQSVARQRGDPLRRGLPPRPVPQARPSEP
jgi:hypothetical protein